MTSHRRLLLTLATMACTLFALTATASAAPPANDDFANAITLSTVTPYSGTNAEATLENSVDPTELERLQQIVGWGFFNTVWHRFDAPSSGEVRFTVCASFPTNHVATIGSSISMLAAPSSTIGPIALQGTAQAGLNDPSGCAQGTYATKLGPIQMQAGDTIRPMVGSAFNGDTGTYTITTDFTAAPPNDNLSAAATLYSRHSIEGSNIAASRETAEPNSPYTNYKTVWYAYTAPATDTADIEVCADFPVNVVAYTGSSFPLSLVTNTQGPTPNTCNGTGYMALLDDVPVTGGQPLRIQVGGYSDWSHEGDFSIVARFNGTPPNDLWENSIDLGSSDSALDYGDNTNSNAGLEAPMIGGQFRTSSVWYKWTAPTDGQVVIDTCDGPPSGTDLMLTAFATNDPVPAANNIGEVGTDYDSCPAPRNSMGKVSFSATAGKMYWIAVSAESTSSPVYSDFTLNIRTAPTNTAVPTISGSNPFVGVLLTAAPGTWAGSDPITYGYQWRRCDTDNSSCIDIPDATSDAYTLAAEDEGSIVKVSVTATNAAGSGSVNSAPTSTIDSDSDGDGVGALTDNCPAAQTGTVKANGCIPEGIEVTSPSHIDGDPTPGSATGLTLSGGTAVNSPDEDDSIQDPEFDAASWFRCTSKTDTSTCDARSSASTPTTFVVDEDDLGGYIRARVTWANADTQLYEWTSAITVYKISVFNRPSITGAPQVGQTLTGVDGLGVNVPETESGDDDPAVTGRTWLYCTSPTDENTCTPSGQTGATLSPPASVVGKYVVYGVTWGNGLTTRYADTDIAGPIAPANKVADPPAPYVPLNLAELPLPKKASAKRILKTKGKFTIKTINFACPTGGPDCKISLNYTAKVKGKTKKLGTSTLVIPAGTRKPLAGKLSGSGLKLFKKNKKLKVMIAMKGSGGSAGKATFKEFTITR